MPSLLQRFKNLFTKKTVVEPQMLRCDSIKVNDGKVNVNGRPIKSSYGVTSKSSTSSYPRVNSFGCECHHDSHFDDMLNPLNPLNPLSPISPFNPINSMEHEVPMVSDTFIESQSDCAPSGYDNSCTASNDADDDTRRSSSWDCSSSSDSSSYDSSSYDSSSSCDSSCDSSSSCD